MNLHVDVLSYPSTYDFRHEIVPLELIGHMTASRYTISFIW